MSGPPDHANHGDEPSTAVAAGDGSAGLESLEEIAEDMLHLLERLRSVEQSQSALARRLEEARSAQDETVREMRRLRVELLGDRRAAAALTLFTGLVQRVDSLRGMLRVLDPGTDSRTVEQLTAIEDILTLVLRSLGFEEFRPEPGDAFDPHRMECVGYLSGDPDVVLDVVQAGYEAGGAVVRPAHVRIAAPDAAEGSTAT